MTDRVWHNLGDWQTGRVDGAWVILCRGGDYSSRRREDLPLRVMATCKSDLDAGRIVEALRFTDNSESTPARESCQGSALAESQEAETGRNEQVDP